MNRRAQAQRQQAGGRGGGNQRNVRSAPAQPTPTPAWRALIVATELWCRTAGQLDEETASVAQEHARELVKLGRNKWTHPNRIELIEMIYTTVEEFTPLIMEQDESKQRELELEQLLDSFYTSMLSVLGECLTAAGGENKSQSEKQQQAEYETIGILHLLSTTIEVTLAGSTLGKERFSSHFAPVLTICLEIGSSSNRSEECREYAMSVAEALMEADPSKLDDPATGVELQDRIITNCYKLCSDPDDDLRDADDEFKCEDLGTQLLDAMLAVVQDKSRVIDRVVNDSTQRIGNKQSTPHQIKASVVMLAVLPEFIMATQTKEVNAENVEAYKQQAKRMYDAVAPKLTDDNSLISGAALMFLSETAEHLPEVVKPHAQQLTETCLKLVENANNDIGIQIKAAYPLVHIFKHQLPELSSTINTSVQRLVKVANTIHSSQGAKLDENELLEIIMLVLQSAVKASTVEQIQSYNSEQQLDKLIDWLITSTDELYLGARANATGTIAVLVEKLGASYVTAKWSAMQSNVMAGYDVQHVALRSATHRLIAAVAPILKDDIVSLQFAIVPAIKRVLDNSYMQHTHEHEHEHDDEDEEGDEDDDEDDEEDEDFEEGEEGEDDEHEEEDEEEIDDERAAALELYRSLIVSLGPQFKSTHDGLFEQLYADASDYQGQSRTKAAQLIAALPALYPTSADKSAVQLDASDKQQLQHAIYILYRYINLSRDQDDVVASIQSLAVLLKYFGAQVISFSQGTDTLTLLLRRSLEQKLTTQKTAAGITVRDYFDDELKPSMLGIDLKQMLGMASDEEGDDSDEEAPQLVETNEDRSSNRQNVEAAANTSGGAAAVNAATISSAMESLSIDSHSASATSSSSNNSALQPQPLAAATIDTLVALARAKGPSLSSNFHSLWPALQTTFQQKEYHGYSLGAVGEVALAGVDITEYVKETLPVIVESLKSADDALIARYASFTAGVVALKASPAILESHIPELQSSLTAVQSKYGKATDTDSQSAADNATSALGRLLLSSHIAKLDLQKVVPSFLSGLPLKADHDETNSCVAALARLVNTLSKEHADVYQSNKADITRALKEVQSNEHANERIKDFAAKTLQQAQ